MSDFLLRIITPEKVFLEKRVNSLIAPGGEGYLGVLAHHAPLITTLVPGKLTVKAGGEETTFQIGGGILEVFQNTATLIIEEIGEDRS